MLPSDDRECLEARQVRYSEAIEDGMLCLVLHDFPLPDGLRPAWSDLLLRLAPGYPDVAPEMWWFDPPILRPDGQPIPQTEVTERYVGRTGSAGRAISAPASGFPASTRLRASLRS